MERLSVKNKVSPLQACYSLFIRAIPLLLRPIDQLDWCSCRKALLYFTVHSIKGIFTTKLNFWSVYNERILIFGITYPVNLNGAWRTENKGWLPKELWVTQFKNRGYSPLLYILYIIFNCWLYELYVWIYMIISKQYLMHPLTNSCRYINVSNYSLCWSTKAAN